MAVLLAFGGSRIGDTFHVIPLLKKLKEKRIECHWIHGRYEIGVCDFLKKAGLVDILLSTDFIVGKVGKFDVNPDMNSIKQFIDRIKQQGTNKYNL